MNIRPQDQFRLIFHIGAGKTGTSSIQRSLKEARKCLHSHGLDYWGLMLEHAPFVEYEWQKPSVSKEFLSLAPQDAAEQVLDVLENSIAESKSKGVGTAIWSHEWFFNKGEYVIPALRSLKKQGVKIEIIAYVRRHDSWARSAYIQWGIMHKTYKGPIKPFKDYVKERPIRFAGALKRWRSEFPDTFILRNFDASNDVVQDFIGSLNITASIPSIRVNETPGNEELLLRALYNNTIRGEVLPVEFDRNVDLSQMDATENPADWLASLLPSDEDLASVLQDANDDRQTLNEWLIGSGQPALPNTAASSKKADLELDRTLRMLLYVVDLQNKKIRHLKRKLHRTEVNQE